MSTVVQKRTPKSSGNRLLFYQDLASPISTRKGKFSTPGQAAAVSALWRENFGGSDLPPPPMFTLEDRSDFSPESGIPDYPLSPEAKSDPRSPGQSSGRDFMSPLKNKSEASTSFALMSGHQNQQGSATSSWWSPAKASNGKQEDRGKGSPVEGVVQPGALITLPPPREVARPDVQRTSLPAGNFDQEEWVTVYGFPPGDTNLVLREFEKCGVILKHVPGPREANWMHILYQVNVMESNAPTVTEVLYLFADDHQVNFGPIKSPKLNSSVNEVSTTRFAVKAYQEAESRSDAHKALSKNGVQINGVLIVGVKPVDPMQRQTLNDKLNNQGFMPLPPPPSSRNSELNALQSYSRPYYLQNGSGGTRQSGGAIALPAKSLASKIFDVMFGI